MTKPLLLLTNDDGIHSPGIRALREALAPIGEVHVVAPDREMSACSQSLTVNGPLRRATIEENVHKIEEGTPADCVHLALVKLLPRRPDLIVSGINRGANLGDDFFSSGTVGGAREGTFFGVPSIAVSLTSRADVNFDHAASFARRLSEMILEKGLPERTLLNVNVPSGRPGGVAITVQGQREHVGAVLEALDPRRRTYYWIEEGRDRWVSNEMSDIHAIRQGLISITPLQTDSTHHDVLEKFRGWQTVLTDGSGRS
jgi:5'-nucleotidase